VQGDADNGGFVVFELDPLVLFGVFHRHAVLLVS
jgi:hypothetical protein